MTSYGEPAGATCFITGAPHRRGTGRDRHECADCDTLLCAIPHPHVGPCEDRTPGGFVTWDDVPREPWTEVVPRLWLGGSLFATPTADDFDVVFTLWHRAERAHGCLEVVWSFPDADVPDEGALEEFVENVERLHSRGDRVLVRCQTGLNRSALVVALVLASRGWPAAAVVQRLRELRSPFVLCNPAFEKYVLDGGPAR